MIVVWLFNVVISSKVSTVHAITSRFIITYLSMFLKKSLQSILPNGFVTSFGTHSLSNKQGNFWVFFLHVFQLLKNRLTFTYPNSSNVDSFMLLTTIFPHLGHLFIIILRIHWAGKLIALRHRHTLLCEIKKKFICGKFIFQHLCSILR